jgi:hypothetical protein
MHRLQTPTALAQSVEKCSRRLGYHDPSRYVKNQVARSLKIASPIEQKKSWYVEFVTHVLQNSSIVVAMQVFQVRAALLHLPNRAVLVQQVVFALGLGLGRGQVWA